MKLSETKTTSLTKMSDLGWWYSDPKNYPFWVLESRIANRAVKRL